MKYATIRCFLCVKNISCLMILFLLNTSIFAKQIVITGKWIIDKPTVYRNIKLDLSDGYFQIVNNASLTIENSVIIGVISTKKISIIHLEKGSLILKNNSVKIKSIDLPSEPLNPANYYAINVINGKVYLEGNKFSIDTFYSAGLLAIKNSPNSGVNIKNNTIYNFHGGFILQNIQGFYIANNRLKRVSSGNIFLETSRDGLIEKNEILFSGNNNVGDGVDLVDSDNITINRNYIASSSCYSIVILRGKDILVNKNIVVGGITHAIYIGDSITLSNHYLPLMMRSQNLARNNNKNIAITHNYFAQNRYGLAASKVDGMIVKDNFFIQRFSCHSCRKFWTNNNILLKEITKLTWASNVYKEAFTQDASKNDMIAFNFVEFPETGGVSL